MTRAPQIPAEIAKRRQYASFRLPAEVEMHLRSAGYIETSHGRWERPKGSPGLPVPGVVMDARHNEGLN